MSMKNMSSVRHAALFTSLFNTLTLFLLFEMAMKRLVPFFFPLPGTSRHPENRADDQTKGFVIMLRFGNYSWLA